jgi:hypothetical protein
VPGLGTTWKLLNETVQPAVVPGQEPPPRPRTLPKRPTVAVINPTRTITLPDTQPLATHASVDRQNKLRFWHIQ